MGTYGHQGGYAFNDDQRAAMREKTWASMTPGEGDVAHDTAPAMPQTPEQRKATMDYVRGKSNWRPEIGSRIEYRSQTGHWVPGCVIMLHPDFATVQPDNISISTRVFFSDLRPIKDE